VALSTGTRGDTHRERSVTHSACLGGLKGAARSRDLSECDLGSRSPRRPKAEQDRLPALAFIVVVSARPLSGARAVLRAPDIPL